MSQEYGNTKYWDDRYEASGDDVFDWLFSYENVKQYLDAIYSHRGSHLCVCECVSEGVCVCVKKEERFLVTGAGNAPFSPDMFADGYSNIVNVDTSAVVIAQMKDKHPQMQWRVMDALHMTWPDEAFEHVIDKSLIDTILCYPESIASVSSLMCEAYRVLKPGGFLLSFSLHPWHSIQEHFFADDLPWSVTPYNIPNARWNEDENVGRAVAHTMVLCVKPDTSGATCGAIDIPGVLTDDEVFVRAKAANEIIETRRFARVDSSFMLKCLSTALEKYEIVKYVLTDEELSDVNVSDDEYEEKG